jgi:hypothetical protein
MTSGNFDIESADHCRVVINEGLRDDDVAKTSAKYLEAYEKRTGKKLSTDSAVNLFWFQN